MESTIDTRLSEWFSRLSTNHYDGDDTSTIGFHVDPQDSDSLDVPSSVEEQIDNIFISILAETEESEDLSSSDEVSVLMAESSPRDEQPKIICRGNLIRNNFPDDFHYLCSTPSHDPLDKSFFEEITVEFFQTKASHFQKNHTSKKKLGVRPLIAPIMMNAHETAQIHSQNPATQFRVWKPILKGRVAKDKWQQAQFQDITTDKRLLHEALESALRTMRGKAMDKNFESRFLSYLDEGKGDNAPSPLKRTRKAKIPEPLQETPVMKEPMADLQMAASFCVKNYVEQFKSHSYINQLCQLYKDFFARGNGDFVNWATQIYKTLRDNTLDKRAQKLNRCRRECLQLIYDLVDQWNQWTELHGRPSEIFETAILQVFQKRRLVAILKVCLPMDRAQSLYVLYDLTKDKGDCGIPWYSKRHLQPLTAFARDHHRRHKEFQEYLDNYQGYLQQKGGTMNKRLFQVLFAESFNFQQDFFFRDLSMPMEHPNDWNQEDNRSAL